MKKHMSEDLNVISDKEDTLFSNEKWVTDSI